MTTGGTESVNPDDLSATHLRALLATDRLTTGLAVAVLLVVAATTSAGAQAALLAVIVLVMGGVRQLGLFPLRNGNSVAAVWWFALGSWGAAVGVVMMVPASLPVMVVTMLIPAVLSAMYHDDRETRLVTAGLVVAAALVAAIGMWFEGPGLQERVDETLLRVAIVGFVAGQMVPLMVAVRQASVQLQSALADARAANDELRQSRVRIVRAGDAERRRIERDLHDGAQQRLVSTLMQLRMAGRQSRSEPVESATFDGLADDLETAIDELRSLARGIYPTLLQNRGLPDALAGLARTSPADVTVDVRLEDRLPSEIENAVYFVASEALQNVAKHAPEANVELTVELSEGSVPQRVRLVVADDGDGFSPALDGDQSTSGLVNMADRMGSIDGTLEIDASLGGGCRVEATAPVAR